MDFQNSKTKKFTLPLKTTFEEQTLPAILTDDIVAENDVPVMVRTTPPIVGMPETAGNPVLAVVAWSATHPLPLHVTPVIEGPGGLEKVSTPVIKFKSPSAPTARLKYKFWLKPGFV